MDNIDTNIPITVELLIPEEWRKPVMYRLKVNVELAGVMVPEGFETDGASVPRMFWWLFPPIGKYFDAAVVHDYLLEETDTEWFEAAKVFNQALKETNIPKWRRHVMYNSVRLWGLIRPLLNKEK